MADSFYGGKPGRDWVIKARFDYVEDMIKAFQKGPDYHDAWFDELVIIDTHNKNHPDNGRVYRRGFDYTNDMGGALYVGQIVGPRAGTPYMHLVTLKEAEEHSKEELQEWEYRQYPTKINPETGKYEYSTGGDPIGIFEFSQNHDASLVPGKTEDGQFNDGIRWTWVNIRKDDDEAGTVVYLGWEIPYLVNDYFTHTVDQYDEEGNYQDDSAEVLRTDDKSHPYYNSWDFGIPKGIKGDALRNLRVITPNESHRDKIYDVSAMKIDENGLVSIEEPGYADIEDDIEYNRDILVYDLYIFDKEKNPNPFTFYLGDWNQVEDIQLLDDGTLIIEYTHNDNTVFERKIKWITDVLLAPDTGVFEVHYNNGDPMFTTTLDWIKNITIDQDGTVHFWHTKDNRDEVQEQLIRWITGVSLNADNGKFVMHFNNGEDYEVQLDWVKEITLDGDGTLHYTHANNEKTREDRNALKWIEETSLDENTGRFLINYNYGPDYTSQLDWIKDITIEENGDIYLHHVDPEIGKELLDTKLRLIVAAHMDENGMITFKLNTGELIHVTTGLDNDKEFKIKTLTDVKLAEGLTEDHRLAIKYNTEPEFEYIGAPINFIHDLVVRPSDFHLLVLYADPTHRVNAGDLNEFGQDQYGNKWVNNVVGSDGQVSAENLYWRDYGTVKDQAGVLIGTNVNNADLGGKDIVEYLNEKYPEGIKEGAMKDKIVTYAPLDSETKSFYGFDYDKNTWYYLGTFQDSNRDVKLIETTTPSLEELTDVNIKGLVFKAVNFIEGPILPKYWSAEYNDWA